MRNHSREVLEDDSSSMDSMWILTSTISIFTMQTGFGLLESGSCSVKNEANIMVKNVADVIFGGFTYWAFGYGLSFGSDPGCNSLFGWGNFFVNVPRNESGWIYSKFFFQASFSTTSTTIVSGAMAERVKLESYIIFSLLNTFLFCLPAHWVWDKNGFLVNMNSIDIAGAGPVHLVGGTTGLVATILLKPRRGRFDKSNKQLQMGSPTNAILGLFMLWWGWLGFNCGSTFGITGNKWRLAARSAVSTICASIGGGIVGFSKSYIFRKRKLHIPVMISSILGALVSITALCALCAPWEGFVIGFIGGIITLLTEDLVQRCQIDDPVGVVSVHLAASIWSLASVGLFAKPNNDWEALNINRNLSGLFYGGGFYLLGIQCLSAFIIMIWSALVSLIFLTAINTTMGLRVSPYHEELGSDLVEHDIGDVIYNKSDHTLQPRGPEQILWCPTIQLQEENSPSNIERSNFRKEFSLIENNQLNLDTTVHDQPNYLKMKRKTNKRNRMKFLRRCCNENSSHSVELGTSVSAEEEEPGNLTSPDIVMRNSHTRGVTISPRRVLSITFSECESEPVRRSAFGSRRSVASPMLSIPNDDSFMSYI